jgi:hypothetical protein
LRWLNNVSGVFFIQVSLLLIGNQGLGIPSGIGLYFPLPWRIVQIYANAGGKRPIQRQLLVQYKHQANPLFSEQLYYTFDRQE